MAMAARRLQQAPQNKTIALQRKSIGNTRMRSVSHNNSMSNSTTCNSFMTNGMQRHDKQYAQQKQHSYLQLHC